MKLTDKQKEAIKLMKEGFTFFHRTGSMGGNWLYFNKNSNHKTVSQHHAVFSSLRDKKIIQFNKYEPEFFGNTKSYILTELGKTIEI